MSATTKTRLKFGTVSEFAADRKILNNEHAEAYVRELAGNIGQIILCAKNKFSQRAVASFPRFPSGHNCTEDTCADWMRALTAWIDQLPPNEARTLANVRFTWS
ncbi:MAG TPA: hypothetical protein VGI59_09525 [Candidatus Udaeobacter sp.]|jgi:hypothetical protein